MVTGSAVEEGKFPPRRGVILDRWSHHAYKRRRNLSHVLAPKFPGYRDCILTENGERREASQRIKYIAEDPSPQWAQ
ncbi:hypothetical protein M0657_001740 [Pyricularia oryzae]|nr:hypothetical protein MCOR01_006462 [Pyricularia oryzae]KAI6407655.1 hypothetical protein MCOR23_001741 [Pyricularia oryzae]KAI6602490.1 hypothetical protein MCOR08_011884 [Pyricularia oryzae]KAI7930206.1 hypothetical protein M9X92_000981 [Pyricularia oryzae]KAI7930271.1 hypothetical protein M0657_001740 [Pyricularia oryzae]